MTGTQTLRELCFSFEDQMTFERYWDFMGWCKRYEDFTGKFFEQNLSDLVLRDEVSDSLVQEAKGELDAKFKRYLREQGLREQALYFEVLEERERVTEYERIDYEAGSDLMEAEEG